MINSENEQLKGRGTPVHIDYRCYRNYKMFNMFEDDEPSNGKKDARANDEHKHDTQ